VRKQTIQHECMHAQYDAAAAMQWVVYIGIACVPTLLGVMRHCQECISTHGGHSSMQTTLFSKQVRIYKSQTFRPTIRHNDGHYDCCMCRNSFGLWGVLSPRGTGAQHQTPLLCCHALPNASARWAGLLSRGQRPAAWAPCPPA
jgi:hypothetical protein